MKNTSLIIVILIILLAVGGFFYFRSGSQKSAGTAPIVAEFTSADTNETITVSFDNTNQTATVNGAGYTNLVFNQTISASGARYENAEKGLILWNKGDEITLYDKDNNALFVGTTTQTPGE